MFYNIQSTTNFMKYFIVLLKYEVYLQRQTNKECKFEQ